ncbi:MAG: hypothetical protein PVH88_16700 [Ignavibacteria bacterium]|jgi:hypothetical protein
MQLIEIVGYSGSVLVAVSLMMSAIVKLRIINLLGAAIFSTYGFIIGALPVGFLNAFIAIVDIYYLYEMFSAKELFKVLEFRYDSEYFKYFIDFHKKDIEKFSPYFEFLPNERWNILFVLRNSVPAGLVCAEKINDDSLYVKLDYAIPGYRDFKIGKYVYNNVLKESSIKKIFTNSGNEEHIKYLTKMGFVESTMDSRQVYLLKLEEG